MSRKIYPNKTVYAIYQVFQNGTEKPCNFPAIISTSPYATKLQAEENLRWVSDLSSLPMYAKAVKWGQYQQDLIGFDILAAYWKENKEFLNGVL